MCTKCKRIIYTAEAVYNKPLSIVEQEIEDGTIGNKVGNQAGKRNR